MHRRHTAIVVSALVLATAPTPAAVYAQAHQHGAEQPQHAQEHQRPAGWVARPDAAGADLATLFFTDMAPGWHITTGPSVILYHPDSTATGTYALESEVFLFDPGQRNEAFGLFVGGRSLAVADQAYTYFLIRRDGSYAVKRRAGSETPTLVPWTPHAAIVKWEQRADGGATAKNVLRVEVGAADIRFLVNGQTVHTLAKDGVGTDGIVGLRVNHALNLHVTKLQIDR